MIYLPDPDNKKLFLGIPRDRKYEYPSWLTGAQGLAMQCNLKVYVSFLAKIINSIPPDPKILRGVVEQKYILRQLCGCFVPLSHPR